MRYYTLENIILIQKQLENEIPYFSGESNFKIPPFILICVNIELKENLQLIVVNLIVYSFALK